MVGLAISVYLFFFFQAEDGIRDVAVTGVQTCALPIHDLLVPALEQGRQSVELRQWLAPVLGERGRWLGALNPQWGYASGVEGTADPELGWQGGSGGQRLGLLRSGGATHGAKGGRKRV